MDKIRTYLANLPKALGKRGPLLTVVVAILALLVGVSGLLLLLSEAELSRTQSDVRLIDSSVSDLEQISRIQDIMRSGWMDESTGSLARVNSIMTSLEDKRCCSLEADFAVTSLDWLNHAQLVISDEKGGIAAMPMQGDDSKNLQADIVATYSNVEKLARTVSDVIVNWSSYFDNDRDERIKSAEEEILATTKQYKDMQGRVGQQIVNIQQNNNLSGSHSAALKATIPSIQTRSYLSMGGVGLGLVLFGGLVVLINRGRTSSANSHTPQTHSTRNQTQNKKKHKDRTDRVLKPKNK